MIIMKKVQAKEYEVKKYSVGSDERVLKIEGGRDLNTKVNVGTMLKLLGGSIYKSNVSAFREQLVNAISHGCIAANQSEEYKNDKEAFVEVQFDFNKRRVTITDVNGMGIPWNVMDQVVTSLGDSGNDDRSRAGQFGCGMFSFIRMADTTILETWSKETDEHYAYISEGSKWHEIENRELSETGTRIMITFKPEVDMLELVESCKVISDFQPVDVIVRVQGWQKVVTDEKVSDYGRQKADNKEWFKGNGVYRLGKNEMGTDLIDKTQTRFSGQKLTENDVIKLVDKDNDIEIYFTLPTTMFDGYSSFADQYLCNIPIGGGVEFSGMTSVRINFTNEKTWSPPVDRDRLTDESMKMAEKIVSSMITSWLKNIEIKTVDDFKNHEYNNIINSRRLDEFLNDDTLSVLHSLRKQFMCWSYSPDGDNQSAEYMRKNKPRTYVYDILKFDNGNIFSTQKVDKRLYNLYAQHFPEGFMFIIGEPEKNTMRDLHIPDNTPGTNRTLATKRNTLNFYLEDSCGLQEIEDAIVYKHKHGLKSVNRSGGGRKKSASTLSVVARDFSYYGRSDTYEKTGKDVNKSLIWLKDKNYIMLKNTIQSQYYNGGTDFSVKGLRGNLLGGSRDQALNQVLFDTFWANHKFIVKQIPKNVQNAVTEFDDFRDSMFATKIFIDTKGEHVSLIEILRKVHPELKDFNPTEGGSPIYKLKIITSKELFDEYSDLEEPDNVVFYLDINFRPDNNRTEFGFLSNLYMSLVMTNLGMSKCFQSGYSSRNVMSSGIRLDFNEDEIRRELFAKNDLFDKFKYMNQDAPSDFLEEFESFNKKFSKNFSQEVMDITCYILSSYHSGMNSVFLEHNNHPTTKSTITIDDRYTMIKDSLMKTQDYSRYNNSDNHDNITLHSVYYFTARLVKNYIEKQIQNIGKYCLRNRNESKSHEYRNNSHLIFTTASNGGIPSNKNTYGGLTDTVEELKDLFMNKTPIEIQEMGTRYNRKAGKLGSVYIQQPSTEKANEINWNRKNDLDIQYRNLIGPKPKETYADHPSDTVELDTFGTANDVMFWIEAVVESLSSNGNRDDSKMKNELFEIVCKTYNIDNILGQGLYNALDGLDGTHERLTRTVKINEGDTFVITQRRYGEEFTGGDFINLKIMKMPKASEWVNYDKGNEKTDELDVKLPPPEILIEIEFDDNPFLIATVIPRIKSHLDRLVLFSEYTETVPLMGANYKEHTIERKDGKIKLEMTIHPIER